MPDLTEAEGLLRHGAMYPRRLGLRRPDGGLDLIGAKHGGFAIHRDDGPFLHFDLEGRWQRLMLDATHYVKRLDTSVEAIDRVREGSSLVLHRRACPFAETVDLDAFARSTALGIAAALDDPAAEITVPDPPGRLMEISDAKDALDRVSAWDAAAWFRHRERYLGTYGPIGFVPPDGLQAVVVQATVGNRSGHGFGGSAAVAARERSPSDFHRHARDVRELLGKRLAQCRSVYLAGADAFRSEPGRLESWFQTLADVFRMTDSVGPPRPIWLRDDEPRLDAVQGFLDDFTEPLLNVDAWKRLAAMHLRRMTLGLVSGSRELRTAFGYEWEDAAVLRVIEALKSAGVAISVVLLRGTGGVEGSAEHVALSAGLLLASALGQGDQVFLIDGAEVGGAGFHERIKGTGRTPADSAVLGGEREALGRALADWRRVRGVKVLDYSMRKPR